MSLRRGNSDDMQMFREPRDETKLSHGFKGRWRHTESKYSVTGALSVQPRNITKTSSQNQPAEGHGKGRDAAVYISWGDNSPLHL